jgi:GTP cyclohydrolase I
MSNDVELGKRVHEHLVKVGVETPMTPNIVPKEVQLKTIEGAIDAIMRTLHLDLNDDSLIETPKRVAKMYINEMYRGLNYDNFPKCTVIANKMGSELVTVKEIEVSSTCEHHLITIDGLATIAYIPKSKVMGLSKFNRITSFFARRPQVQERLTNQIWHALNFILDTDDIAVYIDAIHFCVKARGVRDANSSTVTNKLGGAFMTNPALRAEFMAIARKC